MKKLLLLLTFAVICFTPGCKKDSTSEQFRLLTGPLWVTDSLLSEGIDAGGSGQLLSKFKGDAKFREDGTGYFGQYTGTWRFTFNETELVIDSDSLQVPLTTKIAELTTNSLKLTTSYPNPLNPSNPFDIRLTFKIK